MEEQQERPQAIINLFSNGVSLKIWPQKGKEDKTYYQCCFQRKYIKDGQEVFERLHCFPDILLPLAEISRQAFSMLNDYKLENARKKKELQDAWENA